jgi:hypothetical protein
VGTQTRTYIRNTTNYVIDSELAAEGRCHIYIAFKGTTIWCIKICGKEQERYNSNKYLFFLLSVQASAEFEMSKRVSCEYLIQYKELIDIDERQGLVMPYFLKSVADLKNAHGEQAVPEEVIFIY